MKRFIIAILVVVVLTLLLAAPALADDPQHDLNVDISPVTVRNNGTTVTISGCVSITAVSRIDSGYVYAQSCASNWISDPGGRILDVKSAYKAIDKNGSPVLADASQMYIWRYVFSPVRSGYYSVGQVGRALAYWSDGSQSGLDCNHLSSDFEVWISDSPALQTALPGYGYYAVDLFGTKHDYQWAEAVDGSTYDCQLGATVGITLAEPVSLTGYAGGVEYELEIPAGTVITYAGEYKLQNLSIQLVDNKLYVSPDTEFSSPVQLTVNDGSSVTFTTFTSIRGGVAY